MGGPWEKYQNTAPSNDGPWNKYKQQPSQWEAAGRGALQGFSVGLADEAAGGGAQFAAQHAASTDQDRLRAIVEAGQRGDQNEITRLQQGIFNAGNEANEAATSESRAANSAASEAHPWTYTGGEVAGILPSMLSGVGPVINAGKAAGPIAKIGMGMATGGVEAGTYGFNTSTGGIENRAKDAAFPFIAGLGMGGLGTAIAPMVGSAAKSIYNKMTNRKFAIPKTSSRATNSITKDFGNRNINPDDVMQRFNELGPNSMPADLHPQLAYRAEQIAQSDNPGRAGMINKLTNRDAGANQRISGAIDSTFGPRVNVADEFARLRAERTAKAKPLYEAAYGDALAPSNEIGALLNTPAGFNNVKASRCQ